MRRINIACISIFIMALVAVLVEVGVGFSKGEDEYKDNDGSGKSSSYVEGRYKVSKIRKVNNSFKIVLTKDSKDNNDKIYPKKIMLVTEYIHHKIEEGMSMDVSFKLDKALRNGSIVELDQLLVYLPNDVGTTTPVWMVSKNKEFIGLNGSRFLKMHSPSSDFSIF